MPGACTGQKKISNPLEVQLHMVVNVAIKLGFSGRIASTLNY